MPVTAIFGGTFNPFHIGHYNMLEALQNDASIEKILILPDRIPPHKNADSMPPDEFRIEMCKIVAEDFKKAEVCLIEFEREGKSYTYDTVMLLKNKYPDTDFAFVFGGDMLVYFDKWYNYDLLIKELPFIVFKRIDTNYNEFNQCVVRFMEIGMKIKVMAESIPLVSSTEIRNDFLNSKTLLPEKVFNFIAEKGLYVK